MPGDKVERKAAPGSLLSQWWTMGSIIRDARTSGRHAKAAWVIIDRYVRSHGNSRASLRYIERSTGLGKPAVIRACRELADWGYAERRVGSGTRPSEYAPRWATTASGTENATTALDDVSGTEMHTARGAEMRTSKVSSGVETHTESYLPSPAYRPADGISNVSASGPGADAPAASGGFERIFKSYGRYGNKQASRKAFEAIINPDVDHIAARAAAWAASAKPGQRRMPLEKWLAAEKHDEADRSTKPASMPEQREEADVRKRRTDGEDAAESAEAWSALRRAAIQIDAPHGVEMTVLKSALEARGGDTWLVMATDRGNVAIPTEAANASIQQEGQAHLARLADSCGVEINDAADLVGQTFTIVGDTFSGPVQKAA